jgi:hypothetical protein
MLMVVFVVEKEFLLVETKKKNIAVAIVVIVTNY